VNKKYCRSLQGLLCLIFILSLTEISGAQVRFRISPYIGGGARYVMNYNRPEFQITDAQDSSYYNLHLESPGQLFFHFHGRIMLLDVWNFSIGYLLWNHHHKYTDDLTELWLKVGKTYPHSYYYTMHGIVVQYTLNHSFISKPSFKPFVMGGVGRYNGGYKTVEYQETFAGSGILEMHMGADQDVQGWGFFIGAGVILFKYAYLAVEYSDLNSRRVRSNQYLQVSVGFTL